MCSSDLGSASNRLVDDHGEEPPFEFVLRAMYNAGYRGDVYPSLPMWQKAPTGAYATFPFPESLDRMREGSS